MPNQRASGQVLIGCHVDAAFAEKIDAARRGRSRSDFLREALFEHLQGLGHKIPETMKFGPDRAGKGGRSAKVMPMPGMQIPGAGVAEGGEASAKALAPPKKGNYRDAKKKLKPKP